MQIDYTVVTQKPYAEVVQAVQDAASANAFRVLAVHDVAATLAEKGFEREPYSIVELCNAKHAHASLGADPKVGLMLPCPVAVYVEDGATVVSTMRPTLIGGFFPDAGLEDLAAEVEAAIFRIVDEAAA